MVTDDNTVPITIRVTREEYAVMALHAQRRGHDSIADLLRATIDTQMRRREEEEAHPVIALHLQGKTTREISLATGEAQGQIRIRLNRLGMTPNRPQRKSA